MAIEVPLTRGAVALVDEADAEQILCHRWYLMITPRGYRYAKRGVGRQGSRKVQVFMHRALMGDPAGLMVDHENGDGLDNRRANLRVVTHSQNAHNRQRPTHNATGVLNVYRRPSGSYFVLIRVGGKLHRFEGLPDLETAARVARETRARLVNFDIPPGGTP